MAQQSARRGRKNQMYSSCLQHAFMIWFRSANSHTGPQLHRCIRGRTDGSIRLRADILQKPLASRGASTDGFTAKGSAYHQKSAGRRLEEPRWLWVLFGPQRTTFRLGAAPDGERDKAARPAIRKHPAIREHEAATSRDRAAKFKQDEHETSEPVNIQKPQFDSAVCIANHPLGSAH